MTQSATLSKPVKSCLPPDAEVFPLPVVPTVVTPRKNERPQRRDVSPRQILLVPRKKLSPTVPQEKLIPIKLQKNRQT